MHSYLAYKADTQYASEKIDWEFFFLLNFCFSRTT